MVEKAKCMINESSRVMSDHPADVFVVVLDCVRAGDIHALGHSGAAVSTFEELRRVSTEFDRCVAPSAWTIPSHASVLTGRYPDQLGTFSLSQSGLPFDCRTLPETLQGAGYCTHLISGNHNLRPSLGLTRGFTRAAWARWGVTSLKLGTRDDRPLEERNGENSDRLRTRLLEEQPRGVWKVAAEVSRVLPRYPAVLYLTSRLIQSIRCPGQPFEGRSAPWIEGVFSNWMDSLAQDQPIFTLVNLMDAHEPYLPDYDRHLELGAWWRRVAQRQDVANWYRGNWTPAEVELRALHEFYLEKLRVLDRRVRDLIRIIQSTGRWEECLFILTSDHGQAFGEGGNLFHGTTTEDPVARVPLIVKWPHFRHSGVLSHNWTSLIDIFPTVLAEAGLPLPPDLAGVSLQRAVSSPRQSPVYCMTELVHSPVHNVRGTRREFSVSSFFDDSRLTCESGQNLNMSGASPEVQSGLRSVIARLERNARIGLVTEETDQSNIVERLRGWGYF